MSVIVDLVRFASAHFGSNRTGSISVSAQITESEKGPSDTGTGKGKSKSGWQIEHKSGYKQTYAENM